MTDTLRIALVDDDVMVRSALANYLAAVNDMEITLSTARPEEAIAAAGRGELDLVVMDVHMPGRLDGIEATAQLKTVAPDLPVLMLTTFDEDSNMLGALAAGASGFLLKDIDPQGLINSIRVAVSGGRVVAPAPARRLVERVVLHESEPQPPTPPDSLGLTEREVSVIQEVCRASSNRQIARTLHLSEATVKSYLSTIMEKLGVGSRLAVAIKAFEAGLVDPVK
ncbi:MAG: response regulator transcription factor [Propionibacteriaceae bacterium]|nr:response regulator transcription factor [Propionibacteriaceae bacterium]